MADDQRDDRLTGSGDGQPRRRTFIEQTRRDQIVQAAIATLADVGYAKTTFARIAERAGISPALISYHFAGKRELIAQIFTDVTAAMDESITAEIGDAPSYGEALRSMIEAQVRYFHGHTAEVLALGQIFSQTGDGIDGLVTSTRRTNLADLETMFDEGQATGEFRTFDSRPMAVTLLAALEAVPGELFARPDVDVDAYARELADIFDLATRRSGRRLR